MNKADLLLTAKLLDLAGDHFCNDMDADILDGLGLDDDGKRAMAREYTAYNCPDGSETADFDLMTPREQLSEFYRLPDYAWFGLMQHKAEAAAQTRAERQKGWRA